MPRRALTALGSGDSVVISVTVMEENLEGAALKDVMDAVSPAFVVIGEATDLRLNRGGRGRAEIHLETIGRPAHSSTPHLGRNAVHDMLRVIEAVERLPMQSDVFLGRGILALTDIISDPYPAYSVIPSRCRVTYDRRLLPGETERDVLVAITGLPEVAGIELRARLPRASTPPIRALSCAAPSSCPPSSSRRIIPSCRRPREGCAVPALIYKWAPTDFAPTRLTARAWPACPRSVSGRAARRTRDVVDERIAVADVVAAERGYRGIIEAALVQA